MQAFRKVLYLILIILAGFLSLTALGGGIALLFNLYAPPVEQLGDSVFKDFTIPGLALFFGVGGSALLATVLLFRRSKYALLFATTAAVVILFFEFVEILVIGSSPGVARTLQIFYVGLGTLIAIFTMALWFLDLRAAR